jgi:hypothetical protein
MNAMFVYKLIKKFFITGVLAPVLLLAFASIPAGASPKVTVLSLWIIWGAERI